MILEGLQVCLEGMPGNREDRSNEWNSKTDPERPLLSADRSKGWQETQLRIGRENGQTVFYWKKAQGYCFTSRKTREPQFPGRVVATRRP